jgi:hypothetical protein
MIGLSGLSITDNGPVLENQYQLVLSGVTPNVGVSFDVTVNGIHNGQIVGTTDASGNLVVGSYYDRSGDWSIVATNRANGAVLGSTYVSVTNTPVGTPVVTPSQPTAILAIQQPALSPSAAYNPVNTSIFAANVPLVSASSGTISDILINGVTLFGYQVSPMMLMAGMGVGLFLITRHSGRR